MSLLYRNFIYLYPKDAGLFLLPGTKWGRRNLCLTIRFISCNLDIEIVQFFRLYLFVGCKHWLLVEGDGFCLDSCHFVGEGGFILVRLGVRDFLLLYICQNSKQKVYFKRMMMSNVKMGVGM